MKELDSMSFIADVAKEDINLIEVYRWCKVLRLNVSEQVYVESILFKMFDEDEKSYGLFNLWADSLTELLLFINRYINVTGIAILILSAMYIKRCPVAGYLMANYMKRITRACGWKILYNPCHLSRSLKGNGVSFIEYLNSLRIKKHKGY